MSDAGEFRTVGQLADLVTRWRKSAQNNLDYRDSADARVWERAAAEARASVFLLNAAALEQAVFEILRCEQARSESGATSSQESAGGSADAEMAV